MQANNIEEKAEIEIERERERERKLLDENQLNKQTNKITY
jgi:hypothetical protein